MKLRRRKLLLLRGRRRGIATRGRGGRGGIFRLISSKLKDAKNILRPKEFLRHQQHRRRRKRGTSSASPFRSSSSSTWGFASGDFFLQVLAQGIQFYMAIHAPLQVAHKRLGLLLLIEGLVVLLVLLAGRHGTRRREILRTRGRRRRLRFFSSSA